MIIASIYVSDQILEPKSNLANRNRVRVHNGKNTLLWRTLGKLIHLFHVYSPDSACSPQRRSSFINAGILPPHFWILASKENLNDKLTLE